MMVKIILLILRDLIMNKKKIDINKKFDYEFVKKIINEDCNQNE